MKKVMVSVLAAACLAACLSGCSMFKKSTITVDKFDEFLDEVDAKDKDIEDMEEWLEEEGLSKKGVCAFGDDDDFEVLGESFENGGYAPAGDDLEEFSLYCKGGEEYGTFLVLLTFKDEDAAIDYLNDTVDLWDDDLCDSADDWAIADEEETEIMAWFDCDGTDIYVSEFQNKENVLLMINTDDEDTLDDVVDFFELTDITKVLDD